MYNGERLTSLMEGGGHLFLMEQCLTLIELETVFGEEIKCLHRRLTAIREVGSLLGGWRRESFREADRWDVFQ